MSKLKPCPFCGGPSLLRGAEDLGYFAACETSGCYGFNNAKWSRHDAIEAYNRRTHPQPVTPAPQECDHDWRPDADVMNAWYCPKCDVTRTKIATHPQPVTPAGGEVERALSEAATVAAIHSQYPATTEYDQGYGAGRKDAAMAIRDLAKTYTNPPVADAALLDRVLRAIRAGVYDEADDLLDAALNQRGGG